MITYIKYALVQYYLKMLTELSLYDLWTYETTNNSLIHCLRQQWLRLFYLVSLCINVVVRMRLIRNCLTLPQAAHTHPSTQPHGSHATFPQLPHAQFLTLHMTYCNNTGWANLFSAVWPAIRYQKWNICNSDINKILLQYCSYIMLKHAPTGLHHLSMFWYSGHLS